MSFMEARIETYSEAFNEEVVYQNPLLFLKIWEICSESTDLDVQHAWPWHYHKEVEFLIVVQGHLDVQSKNNRVVLGPGDCIILGSSQPHRTQQLYQKELQYIVFQVDLGRHFDQSAMPYLYCFSELTHPLDELNYIFEENELARREAHRLIMGIFKESQSLMRGYEIAISSAIKQLILLLLRSDTRNVLNYSEEIGLHRLRPILEYVDTHLTEKISVEDACSLLNLSYHYFIKYFKKVMGVSFLDYVNYKRIRKSERLLLTSELSIMDVGNEVGISNMAQFYKLFKRHNLCSPKEFKQRVFNRAVHRVVSTNG